MVLMYKIRLFVDPSCAERAVKQLREILSALQTDKYHLEIVDIESAQSQALEEKVISVPSVSISSPTFGLRVFNCIPNSYEFQYALGLRKLW